MSFWCIAEAADEAQLGTAREVMRKAIAWREIAEDVPSGQIADAGEKAKTNKDAAQKRSGPPGATSSIQ